METDAITTLLQEVAAEVITPRFRSLDAHEVSEKNPGDLVTVADHEAEVLITEALSGAYPGAVVLGEEAASADESCFDRFATAMHAFTVDPVDGTKNFVNGSPDHAVMVAELREGTVVRSWIWQPQHERAYVAERGAGSWCNGERLTMTPPTGSSPSWDVRTSRRSWVGRRHEGLAPLGRSWVSCGIDYPHLVEGDCDALVYLRTMPWDHAPGQLLVTEAGGVVRSLVGADYDPRRTHADGLVSTADAATYDAVAAALNR